MQTIQEEYPSNPLELEIFQNWLAMLNRTQISYVMGGAFAVYLHGGGWRDTKDMDVFLQAKDLRRALGLFNEAGYKTEVRAANWLAKVSHGVYFADLIFGFWNGQLKSIHNWIERSQPAQFLGVWVPLISLEDLIYSKLYLAARDRFDGGDIVHLIRKTRREIDWKVVLDQLGDDFALLLWHLIFYDYVYPGDLKKPEQELMSKLFKKICKNWSKSETDSYFRGPLVDPFSYKMDIEETGYTDPRDLTPLVDEQGNLL